MKIVYQLSKDKESINTIQDTSLHRPGFGFQQTNGLFGSKQWWNNIKNKSLPMHTIKGKIDRVYMAGMNDFPEFQMASDGKKYKWPRYVNTPSDDNYFQMGREIEVDYVTQLFKPDSFLGPGEDKVIIEIRILEDSE